MYELGLIQAMCTAENLVLAGTLQFCNSANKFIKLFIYRMAYLVR